MIERKILIGLITNTRFLKQVQDDWKDEYIESQTAKTMCMWCWEYFRKYKKAPMQEIELVFFKKSKKGLDKDLEQEIAEEILPSLSKEYEKKKTNTKHLLDETRKYFVERQIVLHNETLTALLEKGKVEEVEKVVDGFKLNRFEEDEVLDLSDRKVLKKLDAAFNTENRNLIEFPGALGTFWNDQLVRGGFVGILASEKRGKTFWLLEFMMRAFVQGRNVMFFQAGDMTELQQLMRIAIYLARKSNKEKYCGIQYIPVHDCIYNQTNTCTKKIREVKFGVFTGFTEEELKQVKMSDLVQAHKDEPKYRQCYNCSEWRDNRWAVPWVKALRIGDPLTKGEAKKLYHKFLDVTENRIKISTHANGTLTVNKMNAILDKLERHGFKMDVGLIDYMDILAADVKMEFRHQENEKWKGVRRMSQERDALMIAPTQADALSYEKDTLSLKNFSEDKRKYAHVTAMFGLNQDSKGREKKIGVMRINSLLMRDDDFEIANYVNVLQRLQIGRPFLGSYF